jgi:hypothetical protein
LEAKGFQSSVDERDEFAFDVARVEAGVAHYLHPLRWDMGNHSRDEIEGGTGDGDALAGVGVDVPVGDQLPIIVGDV